MDSNKKKVMKVNRREKEHRPRARPRNKDVNAMKAMKVTMKAMKRRVSRSELHKALKKKYYANAPPGKSMQSPQSSDTRYKDF